MRRLTPFLVGTLAAVAFAAPGRAQAVPKIGYINSQQIIQEAPGAQAVQDTLQARLSKYQTEVQQMEKELQDMVDRFQQQQLTLSDQAKQSRQQEIQQKQQQYQQRVQQLQQQAQQQRAQLVQPILDRINGVIEQIRREGNYSMIFDVSTPGVLAADPGLDLTPEVIRRLKQEGTLQQAPDSTSGSTSGKGH